jgi:cytochrome P450
LFNEIIEKRREEMKSKEYKEKGDLLSILLNDELFKNDDKMIIDECLTFFFAAT